MNCDELGIPLPSAMLAFSHFDFLGSVDHA